MGVGRCRQPEVTDWRRVVTRFLHRPKHQRRDRTLLGRFVQPTEQPLKVLRPNPVRRRAQTVSECLGELLELGDLLRIGRLVDAIQSGQIGLLQMRRHRFVRHEHELLDDSMRDVALGRDDRLDQPLFIHHEHRRRQVEVDRPTLAAPATQRLIELLHELEQWHELRMPLTRVGVTLGKDGVHRRVRHPFVAVDDPVMCLIAHHLTTLVDLHQTRLHQPVHPRVETAQPRCQLFRKHVHGAVGKVRRGAAFTSRLVERAALGHIVRHVGDVHPEPVAAVRQTLEGDRVVEVPRGLAVDRHRREIAKVRPSRERPRAHRFPEPPRLGDRSLVMRVGQRMLPDDQLSIDPRIVHIAKDLGHPADRPSG